LDWKKDRISRQEKKGKSGKQNGMAARRGRDGRVLKIDGRRDNRKCKRRGDGRIYEKD